jgi:hypothetical protein
MIVATAAIVLADLVVIGFCVVYLARAERALARRWLAQRGALEDARSGLAHLVAEAEERAREFERLLGVREKQLRDLLYRLAEEEERVRQAARAEPVGDAGVRGEVERLAASGMEPIEVARALDLDPAAVRLMFELRPRSVAPAGAAAVRRTGRRVGEAEPAGAAGAAE